MKLLLAFTLILFSLVVRAADPASLYSEKDREKLKLLLEALPEKPIPSLCAKDFTFQDFKKELIAIHEADVASIRREKQKLLILATTLPKATNLADLQAKMKSSREAEEKSTTEFFDKQEKREADLYNASKKKALDDILALSKSGGFDGLVRSMQADMIKRQETFDKEVKERKSRRADSLKQIDGVYSELKEAIDAIGKSAKPDEVAKAWVEKSEALSKRSLIFEEGIQVINDAEKKLKAYEKAMKDSADKFAAIETDAARAKWLIEFKDQATKTSTGPFSCETLKKMDKQWAVSVLADLNNRYETLQKGAGLLQQLNPPPKAEPVKPKGRSEKRTHL